MESMLLGFQSDLGSISNEIISLQRKSVAMSQQLNNRQSLRGHLSQFVDDIVVSEELIDHLYTLWQSACETSVESPAVHSVEIFCLNDFFHKATLVLW